MNDTYSKKSILDTTTSKLKDVIILETIDSTNSYIKTLNANNDTLVVANTQTQGRGRNTKSFQSNPNVGIYASVCLHNVSSNPLHMSAYAALAVCYAIHDVYHMDASIKWVNDIYIQDKKVCGILCESIYSGSTLDYSIIGVGINVHHQAFDELKEAGSIEDYSHDVKPRELLLISFINHLYELLEVPSILKEYKQYSLLLHKDINVYDLVPYPAYVEDITKDYELVLKTEDNKIKVLNTTDISIRKKEE